MRLSGKLIAAGITALLGAVPNAGHATIACDIAWKSAVGTGTEAAFRNFARSCGSDPRAATALQNAARMAASRTRDSDTQRQRAEAERKRQAEAARQAELARQQRANRERDRLAEDARQQQAAADRARQQRSASKTDIYLDQSGYGDATTMDDAIAKVATNGTIHVRAGRYRWSGSLNRSVNIVGIPYADRKDASGNYKTLPVLYSEAADQSTLRVYQGTVNIEGVDIEFSNELQNGVDVFGGKLIAKWIVVGFDGKIDKEKYFEKGGRAVQSRNNGEIFIYESSIGPSPSQTILATNSSAITIEGSSVMNNTTRHSSAYTSENSSLTIKDTTMSTEGSFVLAVDKSKLILTNVILLKKGTSNLYNIESKSSNIQTAERLLFCIDSSKKTNYFNDMSKFSISNSYSLDAINLSDMKVRADLVSGFKKICDDKDSEFKTTWKGRY